MNRKWVLLNLLIKKDGIARANYLKKHHMFNNMGNHCYWHPFKIPSEPKLLTLHDNVVVTSNVTFVTHDIIDYMINHMSNNKQLAQHKGPIEIFDNVFIGCNSTIMYDTKIGPNAIVAAGSVVVNDVPEGAVVGGVPAKVIGSIDEFIDKRSKNS
ncbi:acyltransferase [Limosilactobacillus vaginalis]|uniref:acyltransferase n=1 Tax=Limosilactobacillus vaginalis TaxID=1633 RepID=UPI0022E5FE07|nr:acyltransferase [Limosilactobacillus vaginalis]